MRCMYLYSTDERWGKVDSRDNVLRAKVGVDWDVARGFGLGGGVVASRRDGRGLSDRPLHYLCRP